MKPLWYKLFNTSIVHVINKAWFSKLQTSNMTGCWPKLLLQQITRNAKSEENVLNENNRNSTNK